jgi:hypothetical protein
LGFERDEPMTTSYPQALNAPSRSQLSDAKRAWCVTKTLAKPSREIAVIAKTGCVRNLSERLTCAKQHGCNGPGRDPDLQDSSTILQKGAERCGPVCRIGYARDLGNE